MEHRAAVFTSEPQAVEVYQSGSWWPGELLGWRHDDSGTCQVWVRVVLGGVEESAWTDLSTLRLPERHLSVAPGPSLADGPATQAMQAVPATRGSARLRNVSAGADPSETVSLPMVRERSANHPAGGRRRAPETGAMPAQASAASATGSGPRGRHRAAAVAVDPGRHRAADTGLFAVVSGDKASAAEQRMGRSEAAEGARSIKGWTAPAGLDADLLTRPMRLSDTAPNARRPRLDGSLSSV